MQGTGPLSNQEAFALQAIRSFSPASNPTHRTPPPFPILPPPNDYLSFPVPSVSFAVIKHPVCITPVYRVQGTQAPKKLAIQVLAGQAPLTVTFLGWSHPGTAGHLHL